MNVCFIHIHIHTVINNNLTDIRIHKCIWTKDVRLILGNRTNKWWFYPSHPIPSHPIPSHPIPSHPIPSHPIPSHPIPSHPIPIWFHSSEDAVNAYLYHSNSCSLYSQTTALRLTWLCWTLSSLAHRTPSRRRHSPDTPVCSRDPCGLRDPGAAAMTGSP